MVKLSRFFVAKIRIMISIILKLLRKIPFISIQQFYLCLGVKHVLYIYNQKETFLFKVIRLNFTTVLHVRNLRSKI